VAIAPDLACSPRTFSVIVVDDHPMVREGLALLLSRHESLDVVALASSIAELLELSVADPDVVLLDILMPDGSGLEAVPTVREMWPSAAVIIVSVIGQSVYGDAAASLGASGFISKSASPGEIREAVITVANGGTWFAGADATHHESMTSRVDLTAREREVLALLASGERVTDIAQVLGLSVKTVSGHKVRLAKKLGAANSEQIGLLAREMGLLI
jgi:two-component system nitrate/nitrite response regulator NarL